VFLTSDDEGAAAEIAAPAESLGFSPIKSKVYFDFEHDESSRAAVLFGHSDHFCKGVDIQAVAAELTNRRFNNQPTSFAAKT
jgi:hypothetical protein